MIDFSADDTTLFLFEELSGEVTIITWGGQEATLPIGHLLLFLGHLRQLDIRELDTDPRG